MEKVKAFIKEKDNQVKIGLGSFVFIVLVLNAFEIRLASDAVLIVIALIALVSKKGKLFLKDWLFPIILFYVYEIMRGSAYFLSNYLFHTEPIVNGLITVERKLFFFLDDIPTVVLQNKFWFVDSSPAWHNYISIFFYTSFFFIWMGTGLILWLKKREFFNAYIYGLVLYSMFSTLLFFAAPTAPPWYASEVGALPEVERIMWNGGVIADHDITTSLIRYGRNDFAAFPSHHAFWPFFAALFIVKAFGKKHLWIFIFPFMTAYATWYGAEHYVIDSLFGFFLAYVAFVISIRIKEGKLFKGRFKAIDIHVEEIN